MSRILAAGIVALIATGLATFSAAAQGQRPAMEATKVDGIDNVYIWRNGNHQSIFIVTKDGVIATDPVAYGKPTGGQDYVNAIKKITDKPIKYLIYSHHHFDHIAGGKAFKDAGATIVAHRRAKERLAVIKDPHTLLPDQTVGNSGRSITLGGTRLDLKYVGLNHSDSMLVMLLPKEKLVFVVDLLAVGSMPGRGLIDFYPLEAEDFDQENSRDGLGTPDPRPSRRAERTSRHQEGRAGPACDPAGSLGSDEDAGPGRQVLGGGEGIETGKICELARLRRQHGIPWPTLLRALGPRHLSQVAGASAPEIRYKTLGVTRETQVFRVRLLVRRSVASRPGGVQATGSREKTRCRRFESPA